MDITGRIQRHALGVATQAAKEHGLGVTARSNGLLQHSLVIVIGNIKIAAPVHRNIEGCTESAADGTLRCG
jgi:hypothetical protein